MSNTKKFFYPKFIFLTVALGLAVGIFYYVNRVDQGVYDYDPSIDRSFIIDLFKKDLYWLISDYSAKDYSVENMLDNRASSQSHQGDLVIKTYRIKGQPIGFVAYYPEEFFTGRLLFLSVDKSYRSKGYARKMMSYAIKDMKNQGARAVRLITRTDNIPGQKLYTSMGFRKVWTDGAYVLFKKDLD